MNANLGKLVQRKTQIKHVPGKYTSKNDEYLVGTKMEARLDAHDAVVGSATGPNWTWMQNLRNIFPGSGIVRGHLLNHDLGGYAVPENLYPISTEANSQHSSRVEQKVKALLSKEHGKKDKNESAKNPVYYDVEVDVKGQTNGYDTAADFKCTWGVLNENVEQKDTINSDIANDTGKFAGSGAETSPDQWQHGKRKGELDWGNHLNDRINVEKPNSLKGGGYDDLRKNSTVEVQYEQKNAAFYLRRLQEGAYDHYVEQDLLSDMSHVLEDAVKKKTKIPIDEAEELKEWEGEKEDDEYLD